MLTVFAHNSVCGRTQFPKPKMTSGERNLHCPTPPFWPWLNPVLQISSSTRNERLVSRKALLPTPFPSILSSFRTNCSDPFLFLGGEMYCENNVSSQRTLHKDLTRVPTQTPRPWFLRFNDWASAPQIISQRGLEEGKKQNKTKTTLRLWTGFELVTSRDAGCSALADWDM